MGIIDVFVHFVSLNVVWRDFLVNKGANGYILTWFTRYMEVVWRDRCCRDGTCNICLLLSKIRGLLLIKALDFFYKISGIIMYICVFS